MYWLVSSWALRSSQGTPVAPLRTCIHWLFCMVPSDYLFVYLIMFLFHLMLIWNFYLIYVCLRRLILAPTKYQKQRWRNVGWAFARLRSLMWFSSWQPALYKKILWLGHEFFFFQLNFKWMQESEHLFLLNGLNLTIRFALCYKEAAVSAMNVCLRCLWW